jgi:hypothetical protein
MEEQDQIIRGHNAVSRAVDGDVHRAPARSICRWPVRGKRAARIARTRSRSRRSRCAKVFSARLKLIGSSAGYASRTGPGATDIPSARSCVSRIWMQSRIADTYLTSEHLEWAARDRHMHKRIVALTRTMLRCTTPSAPNTHGPSSVLPSVGVPRSGLARPEGGGPKSLRVRKPFREQVQAPSIRRLGNLVVRVRASQQLRRDDLLWAGLLQPSEVLWRSRPASVNTTALLATNARVKLRMG